jgi:predicted house-cleaning noncanonical NTP pyrophosphatase (MazG superfamily)
MREGDQALRDEIRETIRELGAETRAGDAETRTLMRVLHEALSRELRSFSAGN